jgi:HAD superfamily hydrolase (TIGR01662 family)
MFNTILFDLDGTLLEIDKKAFHKEYSKRLCMYFIDTCPIETMGDILTKGTMNMLRNDGSMTNKEAFVSHLEKVVGEETQEYMDNFNLFYENEFHKLAPLGKGKVDMVKSIQVLKSKGYKLAIASNPMLPLTAMNHRVKWSELKPHDFELVSSFEKNHYTKPNPNFYKEMANSLNIDPNMCLMVGDDLNEDMVASTVGMKTYFLTDEPIRSDNVNYEINYEGSSGDFYEFVKGLPSLI